MSGQQASQTPPPVLKTFELGERVLTHGEVAIVTHVSKEHIGLAIFASALAVHNDAVPHTRSVLVTVAEAQSMQSIG